MRKSKYTKELLEEVVNQSQSITEVLRNLGLKVSGGMHRLIQQRIKALAISTEHFTGQCWNKGLTAKSNASVAKYTEKHTWTDTEIFRKGSTYPTSKLGKRLQKKGREYKCVICKLDTWRGMSITLHVDHIDGNTSNNEEENLRFLCPNCHQQTNTWGRKNKSGHMVELADT